MNKPKLLRITTVPISLYKLLQGQPQYMQQKGFEVILASANGKEIEQIEKNTGLKVNILPLTRKISPVTDLKAVYQTYKLIKKHQPDIVHTHTPKAGIIGMLAAKLAGVPIRMHTVAGMPLMETKGLKRKILNLVEKLTYWCATGVYPNSYGLKAFILGNKFTRPEKVKVIAHGSSNGIDTNYFNPALFSENEKTELKRLLGISNKDFVFIFVGRLVSDKGLNELISTLNRLSHEVTHIKLLLIGNEEPKLDPLLPQTRKIIRENKNIISTGWVEDVRPYFAVSNALVFPSYREGLPNVVLQANAMGLPAIVTDINGSNEIINQKENGCIIPVKDPDKLYEAMKKFISDRDLIHQMKLKTRPNIVNRYEQKIVWQALLNEYQQLLKERKLIQ